MPREGLGASLAYWLRRFRVKERLAGDDNMSVGLQAAGREVEKDNPAGLAPHGARHTR
jgi:hypothetical protein